jgi:tight adherence protein C
MAIFLIFGVILIGIAVVLLGRALLLPRMKMAATITHIGAYGFEPTLPATVEPSGARRRPLTTAVSALASATGARLSGLPGLNQEAVRRELLAAGMYTTSPTKIFGFQAVATIVLPLIWIWFGINSGMPAALVLLGTLVALVLGWRLPLSVVKRRARQRLEEIDYEMPDLIDTLVTTVEAGIAFAASLQIAARRFRGPLAEELRLLLQEQNMGLGMQEGLAHLVDRADTPAVRSFVRAIIQGELLGVSVGQSLRSLAIEMRKRRRAAAEERAQKAPVKMLFPLIFMIFPALYIVLLGPAVFRIHDFFTK